MAEFNDNVYQPRGGYYPAEPIAQTKERDEELNKTLMAIPRLKEAVEHLDERIKFYESTQAIDISLLLNEKKLAIQMLANVQTAANLEAERGWLLGLIQEASKE